MSESKTQFSTEEYQAMCGSKKRLPDKRAAQTAINQFNSRGHGRHGRPEWLRAYPCPICEGWHLTKGKPQPIPK